MSRNWDVQDWPVGRLLVAAAALGGVLLLAGCERPDSVQRGYRGTGSLQLYKPSKVAALADINQIPEPEDAADPDPTSVNEVFKNVQVLNDLPATEFSRLMQAMSTWIAPVEGCAFCHNEKKLDSDEKYPKVVARRMLKMTREINTKWKAHVVGTGVTCWTCHRGQAVPTGDWFATPDPQAARMVQTPGQNSPSENSGGSALPFDPLSAFLVTDNDPRVQGDTALRQDNQHNIKQAKWTYSLMMYMSNSLGVNCTYCHTTSAFGRWERSTPQRATAWYGIRMVRALNESYIIPLKPLLPVSRLSPEGDTPKVGCATCHKGTYKPLYGITMLNDYPVLAGLYVAPPAAEPAAAPVSAPADPAAEKARKAPAAAGGKSAATGSPPGAKSTSQTPPKPPLQAQQAPQGPGDQPLLVAGSGQARADVASQP